MKDKLVTRSSSMMSLKASKVNL
jgi:hypothetical protein